MICSLLNGVTNNTEQEASDINNSVVTLDIAKNICFIYSKVQRGDDNCTAPELSCQENCNRPTLFRSNL